MRKDHYVQLRLSQDQEEAWKKIAEADGTSLSQWIRTWLGWCVGAYYEPYSDPVTHEVKYRRRELKSG